MDRNICTKPTYKPNYKTKKIKTIHQNYTRFVSENTAMLNDHKPFTANTAECSDNPATFFARHE